VSNLVRFLPPKGDALLSGWLRVRKTVVYQLLEATQFIFFSCNDHIAYGIIVASNVVNLMWKPIGPCNFPTFSEMVVTVLAV
jgi:hypothetical protein